MLLESGGETKGDREMPLDSGLRRDSAPSTKPSRTSPLREAMAAILLSLLATGPLWADWLADRRQLIEQMTPADKQELNEKFEEFEALPPEEQKKLRDLHEQLEVDPHGDHLRRVMQRYYDWLKTLSPGERADLRFDSNGQPLSTAERLAQIKKLKQRQEAWAAKLSGGSHLNIADVQVLTDWVKKYAAAHEAELAKDMPPQRHGEPAVTDEAAHQKMVQFSAWRHWSSDKLPNVSPEEIEHLTSQLSAEPRKEIAAQTTPQAKAEMIHQWLRAIRRARLAGNGGFGGGFNRQGGNVNHNELARFFRDLPKAQRDELTKLPEDEMRHELRKLYMQHRRAEGSSPGSAGKPGHHGGKSAAKAHEPDSTKPDESPSTTPPAVKQASPAPGNESEED
jgi:hypothetical protein